ncbi:MAG: phosphate signaling complex protein PhoU [Actinobacteria bacterium]|uniref:Unannotated protein n=1 Tax=freshwater metagenome TaxID=449393 RepID=A0A6J5YQB3_9ZZZZ|nr:phosphate signaling complex protein PhoU [Actinomycetota bacterium]
MPYDYAQELESVTSDLVKMCELVNHAITQATTALLNDDLEIAQTVIDGDEAINTLNQQVDETCMRITALQAPIAGDLRLVIGGIRMATSIERMGDLASHIAKQVRLRYPSPSIPEDLKKTFSEMGDAASMITAATARVIKNRDTDLADDIKRFDDQLDRLHRELFTVVLSDDWDKGVEAAIDVTLLSRFYERFGDHAVTVARRVIHIVTGDPYTK